MNLDIINASFEFFAAFVIILNIAAIYKDKEVKGVSIWPAFVFACWGVFNVYYYSHLNQYFSSLVAIFVAIANSIWLSMVLYFKIK